jgi:menaquinone-dependent protoporphyrinogen IX oxidase
VAALADTYSALRAQHEQEVASLRSSHDAALAAAAAQLAALQQSSATQKSESDRQLADLQQRMATSEAAALERQLQADAAHASELKALRDAHAKALVDSDVSLRAQHEQEIADVRAAHDSALVASAALVAGAQQQTATVQAEFDRLAAELHQRLAATEAAASAASERLAQSDAAHASQIAALIDAHTSALSTVESEHAGAMKQLQSELESSQAEAEALARRLAQSSRDAEHSAVMLGDSEATVLHLRQQLADALVAASSWQDESEEARRAASLAADCTADMSREHERVVQKMLRRVRWNRMSCMMSGGRGCWHRYSFASSLTFIGLPCDSQCHTNPKFLALCGSLPLHLPHSSLLKHARTPRSMRLLLLWPLRRLCILSKLTALSRT